MKPRTVLNKKFMLRAAAVACFAVNANAQQASSVDGQNADQMLVLDEIIVTAQRRDQSLQQTPVAVTAISRDDLATQQITNILDLQYAAPNISLGTNTGTANAARIFVRGAGEDESRATAEPAVGVYVDGIYIGRSVGALFDLVDLEQVEILRGPQGTLYGRNSNGGAIRLKSRAPSTEGSEFNFGITAGSEGRFDAKASGNVVLGESTALRASVLSRSRDGFHTLNPNGDFAAAAGTNVGEIDTTAFRASLLHNFSSNWSASLTIDATNDDSDPIPDTLNLESDADNNLFTIEPAPGSTCSSFVPANFLPVGCFTDYRSEVESKGAAFKLTGEVGNFTFESLTGYRSLEDDLSSRIGFPYQQQTDQDQLSQEFTLSSNYNGAFNFVTGLFFFEEDIQLDSVFVFPFSVGVDTSAAAAFFQSTYDFSDTVTLTTGIRATDETKDLDALAVPTGLSRVESRDFSNTTYTIGLEKQFTEDVFGYVSYSTGFKSGGWSPDCFSPTACFLQVDEEELDTLEFGLRTSLLNDRLRLNATYFFNNYEGLQIGATVPGLGFTRFNAAEADIDGLELEMVFLASESITINATLGTLNAEYGDLTLQQAGGLTNDGASPGCGGVASVQCAQQLELKNAPEYKGSVAIIHKASLANGTLTSNVDFSFEDDSFNLVANPANSRVDVSTLINARIAYTSEGSGWNFALWGKNLTDEEYARASTGANLLYTAEPLTWGVDFGYSF